MAREQTLVTAPSFQEVNQITKNRIEHTHTYIHTTHTWEEGEDSKRLSKLTFLNFDSFRQSRYPWTSFHAPCCLILGDAVQLIASASLKRPNQQSCQQSCRETTTQKLHSTWMFPHNKTHKHTHTRKKTRCREDVIH